MTLLEVLVVMAILAILAAVAIPSYRRYLQRAQRVDATTALLRLHGAQEKNHLQYGRYVTDTGNLPNAPGAGDTAGLGILTTSERGFYSLSVVATTSGYRATATPVAGKDQADDTACASFRIDERGSGSAVSSAGVDQTLQCFR